MVGTLDINQGAVLPAEQLVGRLPRQGDRRRRRAYISNVATWEGARRQGIARQLLHEAIREAEAAGVAHLYGEGGAARRARACMHACRCLGAPRC